MKEQMKNRKKKVNPLDSSDDEATPATITEKTPCEQHHDEHQTQNEKLKQLEKHQNEENAQHQVTGKLNLMHTKTTVR